MLLTTPLLPALAPLLAAPAPAPPPQDAFVRRVVPDSAVFAMHVHDPAALVARADENAWIGFATDPRWKEVFQPLASELPDVEAADLEAVCDRVRGAVERCRAASFFVGADLAEERYLGAAVALEGEAALGEELATLLGEDRGTATVEGAPGTFVTGEAGRVELLWSDGEHFLLVDAKDEDDAIAFARSCLAGLVEGETGGGPFRAEGLEPRAGAHVEMAADLSALWTAVREEANPSNQLAEEFLADFESMRWIYGALTFGEGAAIDGVIEAPYREGGPMSEVLGYFGSVDRAALDAVPSEAMAATVYSIDVDGLSQWIFEVLEKHDSDAYDEVNAQLGLVAERYGVDVMGDLVGCLTGRMLSFQLEGEGAMANLSPEAQLMLGSEGTFVVGITDPGPYIDALDVLFVESGIDALLITEEIAGVEVFSLEAGGGIELAFAVADDALLVSFGVEGAEAYLTHDPADAERLAARPGPSAALAGLSGAGLSVQDTLATFDQVHGMVTGLTAMADDPASRAVAAVNETVRSIAHAHLSGAVAVSFSVEGGRIRSTVRAR